MKSYLDDPTLKERFLAQLAWHRQKDMIAQGVYGDMTDSGNFRGCAVGCSISSLARIEGEYSFDTMDHSLFERLLGVPAWLAHLEDAIFEGLPWDDARLWPERFAAAVPVGVDLWPLRWPFGEWLLRRDTARVEVDGEATAEDLAVSHIVESLHAVAAARAGEVNQHDWETACHAAGIADVAAARSMSWAMGVAYMLADPNAIGRVAGDSVRCLPEGPGRHAEWRVIADHLVELLEAA